MFVQPLFFLSFYSQPFIKLLDFHILLHYRFLLRLYDILMELQYLELQSIEAFNKLISKHKR